jgi:hypothetical protein
MSPDIFRYTLEETSANSLPQNLSFTLKEWATRTAQISITSNILLEVNHPEFLDELIVQMPGLILKRIEKNWAIISAGSLNSIISYSKKRDCVISLFEENEDINP